MTETIHNIEVEAGAKFKDVWTVIDGWFERLKGHGQFSSAQVHQALDEQKAHLAAVVATVLPEGTSLDQKGGETEAERNGRLMSEGAAAREQSATQSTVGSVGGISAPPIESVLNAPLTLGGDHEG